MRAVIPLHLFSYYYTLLVELKFIKVLTAGLTHHIVIKKRRGREENKLKKTMTAYVTPVYVTSRYQPRSSFRPRLRMTQQNLKVTIDEVSVKIIFDISVDLRMIYMFQQKSYS